MNKFMKHAYVLFIITMLSFVVLPFTSEARGSFGGGRGRSFGTRSFGGSRSFGSSRGNSGGTRSLKGRFHRCRSEMSSFENLERV